MDRVTWVGMVLLLVGATAGQVTLSRADVVLISPAVTSRAIDAQSQDYYPEAQFGKPPIKFETGVTRGYAGRAVEELEAHDEEVLTSAFGAAPARVNTGRYPAGLVMSNAQAATRSSEVVVQAAPLAPPPISPAISPATPPQQHSAFAPPAIKEVETASMANNIARKGVQEIALIVSDLGYFPKTVFVTRDVPVRMFVTGASKNTLCIMMDSFQVRKQVRTQKIEEITFTPSTPGKYRFYCPVNGMEGTLVVREFASSNGAGE